MRLTRVFDEISLTVGQDIELSAEPSNHLARVLRLEVGDEFICFNGQGGEYLCTITAISKKNVTASVNEFNNKNIESPIAINLGQVLSKGDKMDFTIQKAVELGITSITPLLSTRCNIKLDEERMLKKQQSLQKIAISAAEQCGRTIVPIVNPIIKLSDFLNQHQDTLRLTLNPYADKHIKDLDMPQNGCTLLVGPEGGFTDEETQMANVAGYQDVLLGPRVLRTETAALVALSILQASFGDL